MFGTGHQAKYECRALCKILPIERIYVVGRSDSRIQIFIDELQVDSIMAEACDAKDACGMADIIVTATSSRAPLFNADWIMPGTHIASMGADSIGKQELPVELLKKAHLFCDFESQSITIGEFQHVAKLVENGVKNLTMIGDVLRNHSDGRVSSDQVTVFDSSEIALQDLYIAKSLLTSS